MVDIIGQINLHDLDPCVNEPSAGSQPAILVRILREKADFLREIGLGSETEPISSVTARLAAEPKAVDASKIGLRSETDRIFGADGGSGTETKQVRPSIGDRISEPKAIAAAEIGDMVETIADFLGVIALVSKTSPTPAWRAGQSLGLESRLPGSPVDRRSFQVRHQENPEDPGGKLDSAAGIVRLTVAFPALWPIHSVRS